LAFRGYAAASSAACSAPSIIAAESLAFDAAAVGDHDENANPENLGSLERTESLAFSLVTRPYKTTIGAITTRRILYWLAAMVVLLVVGTIIGLIWADTRDVAGAFAGVTNIVGGVGIVLLLIALAVKHRRRPS
jgi:hypothetical protein